MWLILSESFSTFKDLNNLNLPKSIIEQVINKHILAIHKQKINIIEFLSAIQINVLFISVIHTAGFVCTKYTPNDTGAKSLIAFITFSLLGL